MADEYPSVAAEWHPTKNGDKKPTDFRPHSNKRVWWLCKFGHDWEAPINNRTGTYKRGCPTCASYTRTSFPEKAIFFYVSHVFPDAISNSYVDVGGVATSLDVWIPSIKTAIEYDGEQWHKSLARDAKKTVRCIKNGIRLIRVREPGCADLESMPNVDVILRSGVYDSDSLDDAIMSVFEVLHVEPIDDIDSERDKSDIRALMMTSDIKNSFGENYPDLAKEWHPTKNGDITPYMVAQHSGINVWFLCARCGNEYEMAVCDKVRGRTCRACAAKDLGASKMKPSKGESFADVCPDAARAWHPTENVGMTPYDVKPYSNKRFWWKCVECGHEWMTSVSHMTRKGNPYCKDCNTSRSAMSSRKSPEQFAMQVKRTVKNVELLGEYTRESDKIECLCTKCNHKWFAWPNNLLRGHGCDMCARDTRRKTRARHKSEKEG